MRFKLIEIDEEGDTSVSAGIDINTRASSHPETICYALKKLNYQFLEALDKKNNKRDYASVNVNISLKQ